MITTDKETKDMIGALARAVENAQNLIEMGVIFPITPKQLEENKKQYGEFDIIIGNFGIKKVR